MNTLTDKFGREHSYLRISVTDRCNLRCAYCMPPEGIEWTPREEILSYEEIFRLTRLLARQGVNKVRITGGEPLVRRNLEELIRMIADLDAIQSIGLTTNGVYLAGRARALRQAGITHMNVSLDTLKRDRFERITLRADYEKVLRGIDAALDAGFVPLKLNVVVMGGVNDDEVLDFVAFARYRPINVRFIEFMPFDNNHWSPKRLVSYAEMTSSIRRRYDLIPRSLDRHAVAKDFEIEGFAGTISFITSMTEDFCAGCNRIRLTVEGALKPCLHDSLEVNLRDSLRTGAPDEVLEQMIRDVIVRKKSGHAPMDRLVQLSNRSMIQIGG